MDRLAVRKQNHPEEAPASLRNLGPPSNAPVWLDMLVLRAFYCPLNPLVPYSGTIWAISSGLKVACGFHAFSLVAA